MHHDIEKVIHLIDEKITELQKAKQTLLEAFGEKSNPTPTRTIKPQITCRRKFTRKDAVIKLIKNEGPLSRSDIQSKSGIPRGTIAAILIDKDTFISKDGKWDLRKKGSAPHIAEAEPKDETGELGEGLKPLSL